MLNSRGCNNKRRFDLTLVCLDGQDDGAATCKRKVWGCQAAVVSTVRDSDEGHVFTAQQGDDKTGQHWLFLSSPPLADDLEMRRGFRRIVAQRAEARTAR